MKHSDKNQYTARHRGYVIVRNLSKFTLCSRLLNIHPNDTCLFMLLSHLLTLLTHHSHHA